MSDVLADLLAMAEIAVTLGAQAIGGDPLAFAISHAGNGWPVFPLRSRSKAPAIANAHPEGDPLRGKCTGDCGREGHGFHDATASLPKVLEWSLRYPGCNWGWVPDWADVIVFDLDRHHGDQDGIARFATLIGTEYPDTMTVESGGGGRHVFYRREGLDITRSGLDRRFGKGHGIDVKTDGYLVAPGSIHPDTGRPYTGQLAPIAAMPYALRRIVVEPKQVAIPKTSVGDDKNSVADWFSALATWESILIPAGWTLISGDGESYGSLWRHPAATSPHSAMVDEYGVLHVFSPNTELRMSEGRGSGTGNTKFRAFADLHCAGDMTAAALQLLDIRNGMR